MVEFNVVVVVVVAPPGVVEIGKAAPEDDAPLLMVPVAARLFKVVAVAVAGVAVLVEDDEVFGGSVGEVMLLDVVVVAILTIDLFADPVLG